MEIEENDIIRELLEKLDNLDERANLNACHYIRQIITKDLSFNCTPIITNLLANGYITIQEGIGGQAQITNAGRSYLHGSF